MPAPSFTKGDGKNMRAWKFFKVILQGDISK